MLHAGGGSSKPPNSPSLPNAKATRKTSSSEA
jgi:hypothetical protein